MNKISFKIVGAILSEHYAGREFEITVFSEAEKY
jgi:hypothetical protein